MSSSYKLEFYKEPLLEFAHSQKSDYCKDGLFLYGPLKNQTEISYGVIGHEEGIKRFENWISAINSYIRSADAKKLHFSSYPGFKSIFGTNLKLIDNAKIYVDKNTILNKIKQDNINIRKYNLSHDKCKNQQRKRKNCVDNPHSRPHVQVNQIGIRPPDIGLCVFSLQTSSLRSTRASIIPRSPYTGKCPVNQIVHGAL